MTRFLALVLSLAVTLAGCADDDDREPAESNSYGAPATNASDSISHATQPDASVADREGDSSSEGEREAGAIAAGGVREAERRYDGLTLTQWRERIKDLDPDDPASATAVPGLIEIVRDTDAPWYSRRQAALTLGRIGPVAKEAVPLLVLLLDENGGDENPTPLWAIKALELFGPEAKDAAKALISRLQDTSAHKDVRQAALGALSQIGTADPGVVPALIRTLSSTSQKDDLRGLAAEALAVIGSPASAAVPALIRSTDSENELLRRRSVRALGAMGPMAEAAAQTLAELIVFDESPAVRDRAAEALAQIGKPAESLLVYLLADKDPQVRWRVAMSLGKIQPPAISAVPALEKAIGDQSAEVRIHAIEALWTIHRDAETIIPPLLAELVGEDRRIRMRAFRLLVTMGKQAQPAIPALRALLADERPFVRQIARKAIDELTKQQETGQ